MAITWRGSESEREAVAFRALVRRLREFMDGRAHTYADGVLIEGHIGERQGTIQLLSINGENQLLVSLACGRSPSLHILPITAKHTQSLDAYTEPEHSVSRLHSIWTDDIAAVGGLLSNPDNLRTIREFCLHRSSSLRIGNGTIDFYGPVPSSGDYFENIRAIVLKLSGIAGAFERERVHLPRSHVREMLVIAAAVVCVIVSTALAAPPLRNLFSHHESAVKLIHFEPSPIAGWRGITPDDFAPEDLEWFADRHQAPQRVTYIDFDGSQQETGSIQFLRRNDAEDVSFRVMCYEHGKQLSDDTYPQLAFALKLKTKELRNARWTGTAPTTFPMNGEALLVVQSRKDPGSGVIYIVQNGKVEKFHPGDFRFQ